MLNADKKVAPFVAPQRELGFLIFPGFPMACLTSMIEPLRAANEISGIDAFGWTLLSEDADRVASSAGVNFDPDLKLSDLGPPGQARTSEAAASSIDYLFLLSSPLATFEKPASVGHLRHLARHGMTVGGVSGGVFPLARAGLVDGHSCSVHWCYRAAFLAEFTEIEACDDVIVRDRLLYTASGAAAAFDMMLLLIEAELGAPVMTEVACWFQHPLVRGDGVRQRMPALRTSSADDMLPDPVREAVDLFADHIDDLISVADVADRLGQSPRQLERLFKKSTGQSPSHYYRMMRMRAARELVLYSGDSLAAVARAVGYTSVTPLAQHYTAAFGLSPSEERAKINLFRVQNNRAIPSS